MSQDMILDVEIEPGDFAMLELLPPEFQNHLMITTNCLQTWNSLVLHGTLVQLLDPWNLEHPYLQEIKAGVKGP